MATMTKVRKTGSKGKAEAAFVKGSRVATVKIEDQQKGESKLLLFSVKATEAAGLRPGMAVDLFYSEEKRSIRVRVVEEGGYAVGKHGGLDTRVKVAATDFLLGVLERSGLSVKPGMPVCMTNLRRIGRDLHCYLPSR